MRSAQHRGGAPLVLVIILHFTEACRRPAENVSGVRNDKAPAMGCSALITRVRAGAAWAGLKRRGGPLACLDIKVKLWAYSRKSHLYFRPIARLTLIMFTNEKRIKASVGELLSFTRGNGKHGCCACVLCTSEDLRVSTIRFKWHFFPWQFSTCTVSWIHVGAMYAIASCDKTRKQLMLSVPKKQLQAKLLLIKTDLCTFFRTF